jgi:hypothetical protein
MSRRLLGGSDEPCCDRDIGHRSGRGALLVPDTHRTVSLTRKAAATRDAATVHAGRQKDRPVLRGR